MSNGTQKYFSGIYDRRNSIGPALFPNPKTALHRNCVLDNKSCPAYNHFVKKDGRHKTSSIIC